MLIHVPGSAQQQGEAAYKKDARDATTSNRRVATEEEYTAFKNTKEFKPLVPCAAAEQNGATTPAGAADISTEGLEVAGVAGTRERRGFLGVVDKRAALLAGAALACSFGISTLLKVINA